MRILFTIITLIIFQESYTQVAYIDWQKCYGSSSLEEGNSMDKTNDGGYIIAGRSSLVSGDVTTNYGGSDIWVIKVDSIGNLEWEKSYGGSDEEITTSIKRTIDNCYIIVGYTESNNGIFSINNGHHDAFIIKIDSIGDVLWSKTIGGSNFDYFYSVEETIDGGYIASGFTASDDGDINGNHGVWGSRDYLVVKYSSNGNVLWQKCYGGSEREEAYSITKTNNGGFIIAGRSNSSDGQVTGLHDITTGWGTTSSDYWIVKIDSTGNIEWENCYGGSNSDIAYSIKQTNDNGYIIVGISGSEDGDVTGHDYNFDYWVLKLNNTGNIQWNNCYGGYGHEIPSSIIQTSTGGYVVSGITETNNNGDVQGWKGQNDFWIIGIDSLGQLIWQRCLGGTEEDHVVGPIMETTDGGFIVVGSSKSNNNNVSGNHGDLDVWLVKLLFYPTGIKQEEVNQQYKLFPNPTRYQLSIDTKLDISEITIIDITGKTIKVIKPDTKTVNVADLPSGVYFIKLFSVESLITKKFIKQ